MRIKERCIRSTGSKVTGQMSLCWKKMEKIKRKKQSKKTIIKIRTRRSWLSDGGGKWEVSRWAGTSRMG